MAEMLIPPGQLWVTPLEQERSEGVFETYVWLPGGHYEVRAIHLYGTSLSYGFRPDSKHPDRWFFFGASMFTVVNCGLDIPVQVDSWYAIGALSNNTPQQRRSYINFLRYTLLGIEPPIHIPAPWRRANDDDYHGVFAEIVADVDGDTLYLLQAVRNSKTGVTPVEQDENIKHVVRCVNALAGVPDQVIDQGLTAIFQWMWDNGVGK